jgi:WD40 repeat protein
LLYAGSEDGTVRVHDLRLSGSQMVYKNDCEINTVVLSPTEGELIAGDQNGKMLIYDLVAGKVRAEMVYTFLI